MFRKSRPYNDKTVPLLAYWTRLYVLVLLLSLLGLAAISGVWVWVNTYNHHYELLELRALQLAEAYERLPGESAYPERLLQDRPARVGLLRTPLLFQIVDRRGKVYVYRNTKNPDAVLPVQQETPPSYQAVLAGQTVRERVEIDSQTWLRVGVPLSWNGVERRALYVSSPTRGVLEQISRLYGWLALITVTIGLAGWLVIYFLSRKLARPLLQVAAAAQTIARGKYDAVLPQRLKERELQQLVTSFRDMASQLQKLEQLRTGLLAGVSHELRTPITSIRGMIQAVRDRVVTGREAEKFLQISLAEAKRLQNMVEGLLDLSSLESGAAPIEWEDVDLCRLVDESIQQVLVLPEFGSVQFKRVLPAEPVIVRGDAGRLRQIILNLISNSRKASAAQIQITLRAGGDAVSLDVRDDGAGIAPEDQPYIFERFYRGGDGQKKDRGLGLGLTISRLLARAHGGDLILLENSPGGSSFRLTLPAVRGRPND
ncbi:MAG: sensor histidine kinase [Bacillota bacterium]